MDTFLRLWERLDKNCENKPGAGPLVAPPRNEHEVEGPPPDEARNYLDHAVHYRQAEGKKLALLHHRAQRVRVPHEPGCFKMIKW